jgi:hypothetical protein
MLWDETHACMRLCSTMFSERKAQSLQTVGNTTKEALLAVTLLAVAVAQSSTSVLSSLHTALPIISQ